MATDGQVVRALFAPDGRGERVAIREPDRAWTYDELASHAGRVAATLWQLGTRMGDRVVILMPDSLEAVASIIGAWWAGAVAMPMSELGRPNELRDAVRDAGAAVALVHSSLEPALDEVRRELPSLHVVVAVAGAGPGALRWEDLVGNVDPVEPAHRELTDPALLLYTVGAGAGGGQKGVLHSHGGLLAAARHVGQGMMGLSAADRVLSTNKLSTAQGLTTGLLFPLQAGAEAVVVPVQPRSRVIYEVARILPVTVICSTPSLYSHLCDDFYKSDEDAFRSLRLAVACDEAFPAELADKCREKLGIHVASGYGSTETLGFVLMNTATSGRPDALGRPLPGFSARVVNEEGESVAAQDIGHLEIAGPTLALGYLGDDPLTADTFQNGWLKTRDRVFMDADGYYFLCGREDELFKVSGKWVSPGEVERALIGHEAVWEVAVLGYPDENGLTKPYAFVVPNVGHAPSDALATELKEFVKNELAPFKYPRWIEFLPELPKGPHGSVLRYKLKPKSKTKSTIPPG